MNEQNKEINAMTEVIQEAGTIEAKVGEEIKVDGVPLTKAVNQRLSQAQQSRTRNITIVANTNSWMQTTKLGELLTKVITEQVMPGKVFKVTSVTTASTRPEQKSRADRLADAVAKIQDGLGEVESLAEEMRSWADNMSGAGTGLENTQKYSDVDEAASSLESAKDAIESAASELDNVNFPTMYG